MVLEAIAGAVGTVAGGVGSVISTGYGNYDIAGLSSGVLLAGRSNTVGQEFQKSLSAIDYKIQRQQLHREDIRDLMELTVGRMDIYMVVGTLLVNFCFTWFTDNGVLAASHLPTWFINLFLVNNFAGCGFLLLSVWLAMHASISSHSISVRLLTSFARLSIPTKRELNKIRPRIYPFVHNFLERGQRILHGAPASKRAKLLGGLRRLYGGESSKDKPVPAEVVMPSAPVTSIDQREDDDDGNDTDHFRRYMQEQRRWICYDAYARVCMSFGINQVLEALSYYILGIVWVKAPIAACLSIMAVKMLGLILMKLDSYKPASHMDLAALFFFYLLPPVLAGVLLWKPGVLWSLSDGQSTLYASVCYLLKAGWLLYSACHLWQGPTSSDSNGHRSRYLPDRMRTVCYLDVVNLEQTRMAETLQQDTLREQLAQLARARVTVEGEVQKITAAEETAGAVGAASRRSAAFERLRGGLEESLSRARQAGFGVEHGPEAAAEIERASHVLNFIDIWTQTPEVLAALEALRDDSVQAWLPEEEKRAIEASYQAFLHQCRAHGLGVVDADPTQPPEGDASETTLHARHVAAAEKQTVRVDASGEFGLPQSVFIDTKTCDLVPSAPTQPEGSTSGRAPPQRLTSFHNAVQVRLPQWQRDVGALELESEDQRLAVASTAASSSGLSSTAQFVQRRDMKPLLPAEATPPDELPGRVVKYFIGGTALWWAIAALINVLLCLSIIRHTTPKLATESMHVAWPEPFFQVTSLHCNGSRVWIHNGFSLYASRMLPNGSGMSTLAKVPGVHGAVAAVLCGEGGCDAAVTSAEREVGGSQAVTAQAWTLTSLDITRPASRLLLQPSWRVVAASRTQCTATSCDEAVLASWDGERVLISALRRGNASTVWSAEARYEVRPGLGRCPVDRPQCFFGHTAAYGVVRALHLDSGGRRLAVLADNGLLDLWDLPTSTLVERWSLSEDHVGMCSDGVNFVFARRDTEDVVIESARIEAGGDRTVVCEGDCRRGARLARQVLV